MPIFYFFIAISLITYLPILHAADTENDLRIDYNENFGQTLIGTAVVQHDAIHWEGANTASISVAPSENTNFLPADFYLTGNKEFYVSTGQEDNYWFYLSGNLKSASITNADSTSSALGIAFIPVSERRQEGQLDFLVYSHTSKPILKAIKGEGVENPDAVALDIQYYRNVSSVLSDQLIGNSSVPSEVKVTNTNTVTFVITPQITQSGYDGKHVVFSIVANDNCTNGKSFTENFSKLRNDVEDINNYFDFLNKSAIVDFINLSGCSRTYSSFLVSAGKSIEMTVTNLVSRNTRSNAEATYYFYVNGYKDQAKAVKVIATTENIIDDGVSTNETLFIVKANNGITVSSADKKINNCTGNCSAYFVSNTNVTLNALPPSGQQGTLTWSGICQGQGNSVNVQIGTNSSSCSINFIPTATSSNTATLTVNVEGSGSVEFITADGARKICTDELPCSTNQNILFTGNSTTVSLVSTANENSQFESIKCLDGSNQSKNVGNTTSSQVTLLNNDKVTCTATFAQNSEPPPTNNGSIEACINEPVIEEYKNNANQYSVTLSSCSTNESVRNWLIYEKASENPVELKYPTDKQINVILDKSKEYVVTLYVSKDDAGNLEGYTTSKELKLTSKVDFDVEQNAGTVKLSAKINKTGTLEYFWWRWIGNDSDFLGNQKEITLTPPNKDILPVNRLVTLAVYEGDMLLGSKAKIVSIPEATDPRLSLPAPSFETTTDGKVTVNLNAAGSYDPDNIPSDSTLADYTGEGITQFYWNISLGGFDISEQENGWNNIDKRQHSNGNIEDDPDQQPSGIIFTYQDKSELLCQSTKACDLPKMDIYYYLKLTDDEGEEDDAEGKLSLVRPNAVYSKLPVLSNASLLVASRGELVIDATDWNISTKFYGGVFDRKNGTEVRNGFFTGDENEFDVSFSTNTELEILAKIQVGEQNQGQQANLVVVLAKEDTDSWKYWHKTNLDQENPGFIFKKWDENITSLESIEKVDLQANHNISVYSGLLQNAFETTSSPDSITGLYHVFVGYRLSNGDVIFNGRSIDFRITE